MMKVSIFAAALFLVFEATGVSAGYISNNDDVPYTCEVWDLDIGVQIIHVAPESDEGFGCQGGCQITLFETGQILVLKSDGDVEIQGGVMKPEWEGY